MLLVRMDAGKGASREKVCLGMGLTCGAEAGAGDGRQGVGGARRLSEVPSLRVKEGPQEVEEQQYMTRGHVLEKGLPILLDTGVAVNSVTEKVAVGMINRARAEGCHLDTPDRADALTRLEAGLLGA